MIYSGFWKRFFAKMIDLFIFLPFIILDFYFLRHTHPIAFQTIKYLIIIIILIYNLLFIYFKGATIGKMILKIRVVQTNGSNISLYNAFMRELFSIIRLPLFIIEDSITGDTKKMFAMVHNIYILFSVIEYLIYFTNPNHKTLHDFIADTVVISYTKTELGFQDAIRGNELGW